MKIVNINKNSCSVYIGRGSAFGNPYKIGVDGNRKEVISLYEKMSENNETLKNKIYNLPEDAILGCHCKPLSCHGDVIIKIWKKMHCNDKPIGGISDL